MLNEKSALEWRTHWTMVLSATIAMSFSTVTIYSMTLFIQPLGDEFGWSRAQTTIGLSMLALIAVPLSPVGGAVLDRFGARRFAIPGVALAMVSIACLSLANGNFWQWIMLWLFFAIASVGVKTTVWAMAITSLFSSSRGLALAVTLSGTALSQVLAPLAAQWLIDDYGWRVAYICLALGWGGAALILLVLFFYDAGDRERLTPQPQSGGATPIKLDGLSLGEAFRNLPLIRITIAVLLTTFIVLAITIHAVPMLSERGVTRGTAAQIIALSGLAAMCGKFASGWYLDRGSKEWVCAFTFVLPAVASALLLSSAAAASAIALVALGFAAGAYMQVYTYLTGHYAGIRNFGKIFGVIASMVALAAGIAPVTAGWIYDLFGTYDPLFVGCIPASVLSALLVIKLGPFPVWKNTGESQSTQDATT